MAFIPLIWRILPELMEYASDNRFRERFGAVRNADRIWVSTPQNRTYR